MTIPEALAAPFAPEAISWRVGSTTQDKTKGMALAYLDARDVMRRFDEVCGPFGWQSEHIPCADGKKVTCRIGVRDPATGEWVWKSDGAGETDVEGEKGSYSDSLKRAAVVWGVGRYLYNMDSPWVALEQHGRSYVIAKSEMPRLRALLANGGTSNHRPANGTATPAAKPSRNEEFFKRTNYQIGTANGWAEWEQWYRELAAECRTYAEWQKFEDDNLNNRNKYTDKAPADVCNSLLAFCREIDHKLNPALHP